MDPEPLIIEVFRADDMLATDGVALGEPISFADELVMDDVYQVSPRGRTLSLPLIKSTVDGVLQRTDNAAHVVHLDCCLTLMAPDGRTHEALILVEVADDTVVDVYVLPLGQLQPAVDYRLVGLERHTATRRFAEAACGAFAKGTHITMADGQMRLIETLQPGDLVLTRDQGKQPIRWIGKATLRASGAFAPVVITKGALHNENDLVLRAEHRLFVYQRADHLGAGRAEVLVKARHLVDGDTVVCREGGFVEYFQLVFDAHHIIFAEGISAESQLVNAGTRAGLPADAPQHDHAQGTHMRYDVQDHLIDPTNAAALLRAASTR
ncbi:Hint domain-containing protein [Yoonia sp.]|jgi:hypothetical protein|uniref:Hint domain-containing protein n=1 Tax=Yoonia sp. TaxID=2212373 RepID=UPI0025F7AAD3|nr:Hint domain-containing protein [Yoonia sp.]